MIAEAAFLVCALALPSTHFTRPAIVSWYAIRSEEDKLKAWIRKNNPGADVFITPKGEADKLREHGWEKAPFTWKDKEIWIQRKPKSDQRKLQESA